MSKWITLVFVRRHGPAVQPSFPTTPSRPCSCPIAMLLYQNSLSDEVPEDPELAKMLMITIAMAPQHRRSGRPIGRRPAT